MIVKKKQISLITLFAVLAAMFIAFAVSASAAAPAKVKIFKVKSLGSHTLELQWDKVKGADGYVIYRAPYNSKKFTEIGRNNYNGTCVVKSGLNANTKYNFAIKAYKRENGKTVLSSTYPILSVCTLPPSVKNISLDLSEQRILLKWSASSQADGYRVYYSTNGGKNWTFYVDTTKTSIRRKDLKPGTKYIFGIKTYKYFSGKKFVSRDMPKVAKCTAPVTPNFTLARKGDLVHVNFALCGGATGYYVYSMVPGGKWVKQKTTTVKQGSTYRIVAFTQKKAPARLFVTVKAVKKDGSTVYAGDYRKKLCVDKSTYKFKGSLISFGDSIAKGTGSHWWAYSDIFAYNNNLLTDDHKNTISGASIAAVRSQDTHVCEQVQKAVIAGSNYTYILLEGGRNDYYYNMQPGSVTPAGTTSFNKKTVCGALETAFSHIRKNSPHSKVIFVLIHDACNSLIETNGLGYTFGDYADSIKQVCQKWGVGVADVLHSGMSTGNTDISNRYTYHYFGVYPDGDGVHPTEYAYEKFYLPQLNSAAKGLKPIGG